MVASEFVLVRQGRALRFDIPEPIRSDTPRVLEQTQEAVSLLRALNIAVCGDPAEGPFRQLLVFNQEN